MATAKTARRNASNRRRSVPRTHRRLGAARLSPCRDESGHRIPHELNKKPDLNETGNTQRGENSAAQLCFCPRDLPGGARRLVGFLDRQSRLANERLSARCPSSPVAAGPEL